MRYKVFYSTQEDPEVVEADRHEQRGPWTFFVRDDSSPSRRLDPVVSLDPRLLALPLDVLRVWTAGVDRIEPVAEDASIHS
ncbi:MAG TPA: hypothetical protein DIT48_04490 [Actinobacteria bacterium]|nr:hypothetical protein [Actinomycetota bacterium]